MPTITIRNVPREALDALKERARRGNRSVEGEVRELIADAVFRDRRLLTYDEWRREQITQEPGPISIAFDAGAEVDIEERRRRQAEDNQ